MKPPALTVYMERTERRLIRRVALEVGLSASALARLAVLTVAAQVQEALRRGMEPERVIARLVEQAGVALAERR